MDRFAKVIKIIMYIVLSFIVGFTAFKGLNYAIEGAGAISGGQIAIFTCSAVLYIVLRLCGYFYLKIFNAVFGFLLNVFFYAGYPLCYYLYYFLTFNGSNLAIILLISILGLISIICECYNNSKEKKKYHFLFPTLLFVLFGFTFLFLQKYFVLDLSNETFDNIFEVYYTLGNCFILNNGWFGRIILFYAIDLIIVMPVSIAISKGIIEGTT